MLSEISTEELFREIVTRVHNQHLEQVNNSPFIFDENYTGDDFLQDCQDIIRNMGSRYNWKVFQSRFDLQDRFK